MVLKEGKKKKETPQGRAQELSSILSKPGAAAMSTWLSNKCIGMGPEGYGALLSEVTFTCSRVSKSHLERLEYHVLVMSCH